MSLENRKLFLDKRYLVTDLSPKGVVNSNYVNLTKNIQSMYDQGFLNFGGGGGLSSVSTDATLDGDGTPGDPLTVVGGGGGNTIYTADDQLISDREIDLQAFDLSTTGTGAINLETTPVADMNTYHQSSDNILNIFSLFGQTVAGVAAGYLRPSNNIYTGLIAGDFTNLGGQLNQVKILSGALDESTAQTQYDGTINTSNGDANIIITALPSGTGLADINIRSTGSTTQSGRVQLTLSDAGNTNSYGIQATASGFQFNDYSAVSNYRLPWQGGNNGDVLVLDGSGNATWQAQLAADGNGIYDGSGTITDSTYINANNQTVNFNNVNTFGIEEISGTFATFSDDFFLNTEFSTGIGSINIKAKAAMNLSSLTNILVESTTQMVFDSDEQIVHRAPQLQLEINGDAGAANQVLTADGAGYATWEDVPVATLSAYDDDTAAGVGGLVAGDRYQTTGSGAAPLNVAGIVMVKQ